MDSAAPPLVALDLESVLTPEIWEAVAERTGIAELRLTTRDLPDYDALMSRRLALCRARGVTLEAIRRVVGSIEPLPGAPELLEWARSQAPVVILSDTFYEISGPLLAKLGQPLLLGHSLEVDEQGFIAGYRLRGPDSKREAVRAFQRLGFRVLAVGDSYNDTAMLAEADRGILFRPSPAVAERFGRFPIAHAFDELRASLARWVERSV